MILTSCSAGLSLCTVGLPIRRLRRGGLDHVLPFLVVLHGVPPAYLLLLLNAGGSSCE